MSDLTVTRESLKRVDLVVADGRIDSSTAPQFDAILKECLADGNYNIVVNLSSVSYMSSAGLRALISALREAKGKGGRIAIAAPSERVSEVLELAGVVTLFDVYDDQTAAVGSF